ncbi:serine/threonine protein kinase, partial [Streptococcus hyovaginalis]
VGASDITSVILAVLVGIMQFSLAGTVLQFPTAIRGISTAVFLSYGPKVFGMSNDLADHPSAMSHFPFPIPKSPMEPFYSRV